MRKIFLKAREIQLEGGDRYKEWAYRKAAWEVDELEESISTIYRNEGLKGLLKIKGVGKSIGMEIEKLIKSNN
ncbi:MAG: hypothetical protein KBB87_00410 [Candidatus Methanofastidiosum sp.]|nr:hypothetical protein [Methanofastidiosum sp.]